MRTTVAIDDDVLDAARKLAAARDQSLGQVVSELMRRGLAVRTEYRSDASGFPTFEVRDDSPPITLEDVKRDEDDPH
jgi:hypothetical protein